MPIHRGMGRLVQPSYNGTPLHPAPLAHKRGGAKAAKCGSIYANFKNRKLVGEVGVVVASGEAPDEAGLEAAHGALAVSVAQ